MNWSDVLEKNAERYPHKEALVCDDQRITYAECNRRVNALAKSLADIGLSKGKILAIIAYNCPEFVELTFASNKLGATWLPLNWRLNAEELLYQLNDSGTKIIVSDPEFCDTIDGIRDRLPNVVGYICLGDNVKSGWQSYSQLVTKNLGSTVATAMVDMDDVHRLMYTSGTTALPKGVMLTYGNLHMKCFSHIIEFDLRSDDRCLVALPLFHTAGMDLPAGSVLCLGGTIIILRKFRALDVLQTIEKEKVTNICLAPSTMNILRAEPTYGDYDLSSLKVIIGGGEKMPEPLTRAVLKEFPNTWFAYGYGLTETVSGDAFLSKEKSLDKIGSVGKPVFTIMCRIVDDDGKDVPPGSLGEVILRGPKVFKGYLNKPKETADAIKDGWFYTGDIGYLDEEGYLYIVDRKKDIIKSGGENVSAAEVEGIIYKLPQVFEVAVVAIPHPKWLEVPKAFVVLKPGQKLTAEQVIEHCQQALAKFKVPKEVEFVSELPRTASGKVLKRELRKAG